MTILKILRIDFDKIKWKNKNPDTDKKRVVSLTPKKCFNITIYVFTYMKLYKIQKYYEILIILNIKCPVMKFKKNDVW